MGAPKQKWTAEEEAALKAGVIKHGAGKWRTILTDPEFNSILHQRSNVDLKDKWRNINVTAIWGSRQKAKLALKKNSLAIEHHDNPMPVSPTLQNEEIADARPLAISNGTTRTTKKNSLAIQHHDNPMPVSSALQNEDIVDAKPLAISNGTIRTTKKNSLAHHDNPMPESTALQNEDIVDAKPLAISNGTIHTTKEPLARLDKLISEAIINLKELRGSDQAAIAKYIEHKIRNILSLKEEEMIKSDKTSKENQRDQNKEHNWAPPNLKKLLSTKLKHMTANGKLIKVKHKYKIAPNSTSPGRNVPLLLLEDKQMDSSKAEESEVKIITKSQVDSELSKMKVMTAEEAAIAAARAVAEAEAAIAEAERAAREAERAEAEAESAQVFAEAAKKALECRTFPGTSPIQKVLVQGNVF